MILKNYREGEVEWLRSSEVTRQQSVEIPRKDAVKEDIDNEHEQCV